MTDQPSAEQLAEVAREFAKVRERFQALNARVTDAEWALRPAPESWSVAENIAHLNLSSAAMLPRMRAALDEARALGPIAGRKYNGSMLGKMLKAMVGPAPVVLGMVMGRTTTAAAFVPGSDLARAAVVDAFERWQEQELALVRDAAPLQIDRVALESPFVAGAKYDGYSALWIVARHELRHLAQAERALARVRSKR